MELALGSCTVRSWRPGDEPSLAHHANNRNVWRNVRDRFPHPYTLAAAGEWVTWVVQARPKTHFAVDVGGEAVGGIGFRIQDDVHRRSAEVGYWLGEAFWGRGIMTDAVRAVTAHAFQTFDLCRLYAAVFEGNPASGRVLEKAGYEYEGRMRRSAVKDGKVIDQFMYAITRET